MRDPHRTVPRALVLSVAIVAAVFAVATATVFAVVAYAGIAGTSAQSQNLAPTAVYVGFWVGVPFLSLLFAVPVLGERLEPTTVLFSLAVIATVFVGKRMPTQSLPAERR